MNGKDHSKTVTGRRRASLRPQRFKALFFTCILLLIGVKACFAQQVSISARNENLTSVIKKLRAQTDYSIMAASSTLEKAKPVTVNLKDVSLKTALEEIFKGQPLYYEIKGRNINIKEKVSNPTVPQKKQEQPARKTGRVLDQQGKPIAGATVKASSGNAATSSNESGFFEISDEDEEKFEVNMMGYEPRTLYFTQQFDNIVILTPNYSILDEALVMGYGTTSKRLNTGSIDRISSKEIETQPVSNPLAALAGRIPGMTVTASNGNPGSGFRVQIQGQNAMAIGNDKYSINSEPLYIIDGVPFAPNNNAINQGSSAISNNSQTGLSPFNLINPADIQSIEVLKDADATAIYGSKGAYGVILITTKKGQVGKTQINLSLSSGFSKVPKLQDYLNTEQYIAIRNEAFANDEVSPDENTAPDLLIWDQQKYTNWQKKFIGNTAKYNDIQLSVSGGNERTQFLISGGHQNQGLVYPGSKGDQKSSGHISLNHKSEDDRFQMALTTSYLMDRNQNISSDLTGQAVILPPNYPDLTNAQGDLVWEYKGVPLYYDNPLSYLKTSYTAKSTNLNTSLNLSYQLIPALKLILNGGFNAIQVNETLLYPISAQNPEYNGTGYSTLGNNAIKSWIVEPQAEYLLHRNSSRFSVLLGSTFQKNWSEGSFISAYGYPSDDLLGSLAAATSSRLENYNSDYRYSGVFTRINYTYNQKYIVNLSGRRDGSSRFGSANRFGNFGALGLAYIFSEEAFIKKNLKFLSFGKLRTSYGITGSDQIGNYQFMDTWTASSNPYGKISGLYPTRLANPDFKWERNNKFSAALELGFLKDKLFLSANYYNNISGNHLLSTPIPYITGFMNRLENFPAKVKNYGWEFLINSKNIQTSNFSWTTAANITIPKNKLVAFPDFENSSYYDNYVIGQPLNILRGYQVMGVNKETGVFELNDLNGDGIFDNTDLINLGSTDPKFYGGINNSITYKGIGLNIFFEFKKQIGRNLLYDIYTSSAWPGMMQNYPTEVLNRWQHLGDDTHIQKTSANFGTPASIASELVSRSNDITYSDASFLRLKNVEVSYTLPGELLDRFKFTRIMLFARAQNLLTFTAYKGPDPETQSIMTLPVLRTLTFGLNASF